MVNYAPKNSHFLAIEWPGRSSPELIDLLSIELWIRCVTKICLSAAMGSEGTGPPAIVAILLWKADKGENYARLTSRIVWVRGIADTLCEVDTARTVGFGIVGAGEEDVPWHLVINARGACSAARLVISLGSQ
jgi:hypothetical protein